MVKNVNYIVETTENAIWIFYKTLLTSAYLTAHPTSSFLTGAQDSHLQRMRIPEVAYMYN